MAIRRSVKWNGLVASQLQLREKITALVYAVRQSSFRTRFVLGSAFGLAFLIAPAAALMVAGNSSSTANSGELPASDPGTASSTNTQASAQGLAGSASNDSDASAGDSSSSTSMSVNVNNDSASVNVGGQTVQGPADGSVSKTIKSGNGNTTTVNIQSSSSATGSTHTFTNKSVHVNSHSNNVSESSP